MTREELSNVVRAAKVVEQNARDVQLQIENLIETNGYGAILIAGDLIDATDKVQEAVHAIALFREALERRAAFWVEENKSAGGVDTLG